MGSRSFGEGAMLLVAVRGSELGWNYCHAEVFRDDQLEHLGYSPV